MEKRLKYGDFIIAAAVVILGVLILLGFTGKSSPTTLRVDVDGDFYTEYRLPVSSEYRLDYLPYPCTLVIDGNKVYITNSTCPGHDCEHMGYISQSGESIVCLPNRLCISLSGGSDGVDAVTQ